MRRCHWAFQSRWVALLALKRGQYMLTNRTAADAQMKWSRVIGPCRTSPNQIGKVFPLDLLAFEMHYAWASYTLKPARAF